MRGCTDEGLYSVLRGRFREIVQSVVGGWMDAGRFAFESPGMHG